MKRLTVTFAVTSFLPCLGTGEEKVQPVSSPYRQLLPTELISEFEAPPEPEKQGDVSHAASNLRAAPKLHRHKRAKYLANIGSARSEMESTSVHGGKRWKPSLASVPGPRDALALQQEPDDEVYGRTIESFDAYEEPCRSWWRWMLPWKDRKANIGIDMQGLGVLNQSAGGQRSFFSLDLSANLVAKNWDFWKTPQDDLCTQTVSFSVLHEPAWGLIASIHFWDPGDMKNAPAQTQGLTIHPMLTAQVDLLNLSFEHVPRKCQNPWPEFKVTIAPQLDLYGRFTGRDAQFQWPLQPGVEWHFSQSLSAVFQVSIPLFTVGGRNPPPSFAIGILWHAEGDLPSLPQTEGQHPCLP